jgi:hypothetical protein
MPNRIDIDYTHARAISQEIGERLRAHLGEEPELPMSLFRRWTPSGRNHERMLVEEISPRSFGHGDENANGCSTIPVAP